MRTAVVGREIVGGPSIGVVELAAERFQFGGGGRLAAQAETDLGPGRFPGRPVQEFGPRVAPAFATVDEHVATAEAVLEPLQHA